MSKYWARFRTISRMKLQFLIYFWWCGYFRRHFLDVICFDRWVLGEAHKKLLSRISCLCNLPCDSNVFLNSVKWARYQNYAQQTPIFEILHASKGILFSVSVFCNIDKVILINRSSYVFVFGDFKIHHKECLIYLVEPIGLTNFAFIFSISSNISQIVNFFNRIPDFDNHNTAILDLFLPSQTQHLLYSSFHSIEEFPLLQQQGAYGQVNTEQ